MTDTRVDTFAEIVSLIGPEEKKCEHLSHGNPKASHADGACDWLYQFKCTQCSKTRGVIRICNTFAKAVMNGTALVCVGCGYKHVIGMEAVKVLEYRP